MNRSTHAALWVLVLAAFLGLAAANLIFGELNQDEGWYLYASRLVAEGKLPYRDFAFTQGPMLPMVYALAQPLVRAWGVAGGRGFTVLLGFLGACAAAGLAGRVAPVAYRRHATLLAFGLIGVNVYQSYFTTVVKTYALCGLLLVGGFVLLDLARHRRSALLCGFAGLVLAGAAATRITAGFALPVAGLYLLASRRTLGDRCWLSFGVGGLVGLGVLYGALYASAPDAFRFFVIDYHSSRTAGALFNTLVFKAGFVSRLLQAYFVAFAGAGVVVLLRFLGVLRPAGGRDGLVVAAWVTLAGITLVQAAAPFPYDDYQVPLFPLFAALLAASVFRGIESHPSAAVLAAAAVIAGVLASLAASVSSPINQEWIILGRDRIWWRLREEPAMVQLHRVAQRINVLADGSDRLLTQDVYLAVETGLRVPPGFEMGMFCYFPTLTRERAEALHVVNRDMMRETLESTPAAVAALSEYCFVVAAPEVSKLSEEEQQDLWQRVLKRYRPVETVPHFGQGATALRILERAPPSAASP